MILVQSEKVDRLRKRFDPHARYARLPQYIISFRKYGLFASRPTYPLLGRCCIEATTLRGDWPHLDGPQCIYDLVSAAPSFESSLGSGFGAGS